MNPTADTLCDIHCNFQLPDHMLVSTKNLETNIYWLWRIHATPYKWDI